MRRSTSVFRYLLFLPDGEPNDPAVLVTAIPNWSVEEIITMGTGDRLRVIEIAAELSEALIKHGFDGVFTVEPITA